MIRNQKTSLSADSSAYADEKLPDVCTSNDGGERKSNVFGLLRSWHASLLVSATHKRITFIRSTTGLETPDKAWSERKSITTETNSGYGVRRRFYLLGCFKDEKEV
jgi:hypothetical protein